MQFPTIPGAPARPVARPDLAPVQPARPIEAVEGRPVELAGERVEPSPAADEAPPRRQRPTRRSGEERRKASQSVLLDTRSGRDRRVTRRRAEDPAPSGVDLSA